MLNALCLIACFTYATHVAHMIHVRVYITLEAIHTLITSSSSWLLAIQVHRTWQSWDFISFNFHHLYMLCFITNNIYDLCLESSSKTVSKTVLQIIATKILNPKYLCLVAFSPHSWKVQYSLIKNKFTKFHEKYTVITKKSSPLNKCEANVKSILYMHWIVQGFLFRTDYVNDNSCA